MKIIKPGRIDSGEVRFLCTVCGCVFEANRHEYRREYDQKEDETFLAVTCPCCEKTVYKKIRLVPLEEISR